MEAFPFNADEAVLGLMARHTLQGSWPLFFYGQAYMGSLDASLVAVGFAVFGEHVEVIRGLQVMLYLGTVMTTMLLGLRILRSRRAALIAGLFMAVPTTNVTLYSTVSLGGYGEALLLGNVLLLLTLHIHARPRSFWSYAMWGMVAGVGFWGFGLTLVYSIPCAVLLLIGIWRQLPRKDAVIRVVAAMFAACIGAAPWIFRGLRLQEPTLLFSELAGSAIAGASPGAPLTAILSRVYNLLLLGTTVIWGLRPPWEVRWLAVPLLPVALGFWLVVTAVAVWRLSQKSEQGVGLGLLAGVCAVLLAGFILTPFGADPSGRYFLPLAVPLAIFAADFLCGEYPRIAERWVILLLIAILGFNLWGTLEAARRNPPGITTQFDSVTWIDHDFDAALIDFLENQNETRGFTNYWVTYPLAFLSQERLIFIPQLPYHEDFRYTARDNRYSPFNDRIRETGRAAYITTNHPALDQFLREGFSMLGIRWKEADFGNYHVFYGLSEWVAPEDFGAFWLAQD